ncbi:MAG: 30S ribosomal protein S19 [Candidatus Moraniibacteriota bacterium]
MTRSIKKGPYVDERLLKKVLNKKPGDRSVIKTWIRASVISPEMVGFTFGVYNGKTFIPVSITEEKVGHRLGEFSPTRKFTRHGGKMQKEMETAAKQKEADSAKAAKASESTKKK